MKTALVTGTTSGFGRSIAIRLAKLGYNLLITGRRNDRLEKLQEQLQADYSIQVMSLCFDIQDNEACTKALQNLPELFNSIDSVSYTHLTLPTKA